MWLMFDSTFNGTNIVRAVKNAVQLPENFVQIFIALGYVN